MNNINSAPIATLISMTPAELNKLTPSQKGTRTRRINAKPLLEDNVYAVVDNSSPAMSMIDAALTQIAEAEDSKFIEEIQYIQGCKVAVPAGYTKPVNVLNQIGQVFSELSAIQKKRSGDKDTAIMAGLRPDDTLPPKGVARENLFRLLERLSNKLCWNVRARLIAIEREASEYALSKLSTMDFTEDAAIEDGIDCTEAKLSLIATLEQAGRQIRSLHSRIAPEVSGYMLLTPQCLFTKAVYEAVEGEKYPVKRVTFASDSYDEIAPMLEEILVEIKANNAIEQRTNIVLVDYTADDLDDTPDPVKIQRDSLSAA